MKDSHNHEKPLWEFRDHYHTSNTYPEVRSPTGGTVKSGSILLENGKMEKLPPNTTSPGRSKRGLCLGKSQALGPQRADPDRQTRTTGRKVHSHMPDAGKRANDSTAPYGAMASSEGGFYLGTALDEGPEAKITLGKLQENNGQAVA